MMSKLNGRMDGWILTAVVLVAAVGALWFPVTDPFVGDAEAVSTGEVLWSTGPVGAACTAHNTHIRPVS